MDAQIAASGGFDPARVPHRVLKKYAEMDDTMAMGRLWGVPP